MAVLRTTYLEYIQGGSSKGYQVFLEDTDEGDYRVHVLFGKIGNWTQKAEKGTFATQGIAEEVFNEVVHSKLVKGYVVKKATQKAGASYSAPAPADKKQSGLTLALLNPIKENVRLDRYLSAPEWGAMEKYDGKRLAVDTREKKPTAINRNGIITAAPEVILKTIAKMSPNAVLDGEFLGAVYVVFDCLFIDGEDVRSEPFRERYKALEGFKYTKAVQLGPLHKSEKAKRQLLADVIKNRGEGIVLRALGSKYRPGRSPESSATDFKYKLTAEVDALVTGDSTVTKRSSIQVSVKDASGNLVYIGNVTVPSNRQMPKVGEIVSVRYLYAFPGGKLYQPVLVSIRDDKYFPDSTDSLKYVARFDQGEE